RARTAWSGRRSGETPDSAPGLDPGPGAGARALEFRSHRLVEEQALAHLLRRIDAGIVADRLGHQTRRLFVGVGVGDRVADRGRDLRVEDIVDPQKRV